MMTIRQTLAYLIAAALIVASAMPVLQGTAATTAASLGVALFWAFIGMGVVFAVVLGPRSPIRRWPFHAVIVAVILATLGLPEVATTLAATVAASRLIYTDVEASVDQ